MYAADMHFWVSLIGTAADKGTYTVAALVEGLTRNTSLTADQARRLVRTLMDAGKIGVVDRKVVTLA